MSQKNITSGIRRRVIAGALAILMVMTLFAPEAIWSLAAEGAVPDTDWGRDYDSASSFLVSDAGDLLQFAHMANEGRDFADKTVTLANDIDLAGVEWTPIDVFSGTFDGDGHTVKGLLVSRVDQGTNMAFFSKLKNGHVLNLTVEGELTASQPGGSWHYQGPTRPAPSFAGGIAGEAIISTIKNCNSRVNINPTLQSDIPGWVAGGIAGELRGGEIIDCRHTGRITATTITGGIVGCVEKIRDGEASGSQDGRKIRISGCAHEGTIEFNDNTIDIDYKEFGGIIGGIAGYVHALAEDYELEISGCRNLTSLTGAYEICGGIIGRGDRNRAKITITISNCSNSGDVEAYSYVGGIVGKGLSLDTRVETCDNSGNVTVIPNEIIWWWPSAGGIIGEGSSYYDDNYGGTLTGCRNSGKISCKPGSYDYRVFLGGIAGEIYGVVNESVNTGSIAVGDGVVADYGNATQNNLGLRCGGIVGRSGSYATVENCYNTGDIILPGSNAGAGGIVGDNEDGGSVRACYNAGKIKTGSPAKEGHRLSIMDGIAAWTEKAIENCYYLAGCVESGTNGIKKTEAEFATGEVAWLLQKGQEEQTWGQKLSDDRMPVLTKVGRDRVYLVSYDTSQVEEIGELASYFVNGKKIQAPTIPALPEKPGQRMGWFDGNRLWSFEEDEVIKDLILKANWYDTLYTVTVVASDGNLGQVQGSGKYPVGTQVTVSAKPKEACRFLRWDFEKDAVEFEKTQSVSKETFTFTPKKDVTLTGVFEAIPAYRLDISASPEEGGTVKADKKPNAADGKYLLDTELSVKADAAVGYFFKRFEYTGKKGNLSYQDYSDFTKVNIRVENQDTKLTAVFVKAPEAIVSGDMGKDGWYRGDVSLKAPEGYEISSATGTYPSWKETLEVSKEGEVEVAYYLKEKGEYYNYAKMPAITLKVDRTAPKLTRGCELTEGGEYCLSLTGSFEDANLDQVTVNGNPVRLEDGKRFTLGEGTENEPVYGDLVIVACDKAGNETTVHAKLNKEHTIVLDEHVDPTCTTEGYNEYKCLVCEKTIKHENLGFGRHNLVKTDAVPATETKDGNIAFWTCALCGKIYRDEEGKEEITLADTVIKALGPQEKPPEGSGTGTPQTPPDTTPQPPQEAGSQTPQQTSPQTGDGMRRIFYGMLALLSAGVCIACCISYKRRMGKRH